MLRLHVWLTARQSTAHGQPAQQPGSRRVRGDRGAFFLGGTHSMVSTTWRALYPGPHTAYPSCRPSAQWGTVWERVKADMAMARLVVTAVAEPSFAAQENAQHVHTAQELVRN